MLILSEKNRQKVINIIRSEIKENQPLASINLNNKLIKKLFLEKRKHRYIDVFGDAQTDSYYIFKDDILDIVKYINFNNFSFYDVIINDNLENEIIITDEQKRQSIATVKSLFGNSTEYISRITGKSR